MKHLILTGDDFGRSSMVNEAVERHHRAGVLTQASLMVNEAAAEEAVRIARRNPGLCVGLHLTLCDGRASGVSRITDEHTRLPASPAVAGLRYAFNPRTAAPLAAEIAAQFARFEAFGFARTYADGHTHLHLHPSILRAAIPFLPGFRMLRLVREPENRSVLALIFRALSAAAVPRLDRLGIRAADRVLGLRETGRMTGERLSALIRGLPDGLSEIYFHPGTEPSEPEFAALREIIAGQKIILTSAANLPPPQTAA